MLTGYAPQLVIPSSRLAGASWERMTRLLHRQRTLGAPFKPCFGLEWDTPHSTPQFWFVIRSEAEGSAVPRTLLAMIFDGAPDLPLSSQGWNDTANSARM